MRITMKKRYKVLLGILGCVLIFLAGGWAQEKIRTIMDEQIQRGADLFNQQHLEEGLKRYAPTRIEWLALKLNRFDMFPHDERMSVF